MGLWPDSPLGISDQFQVIVPPPLTGAVQILTVHRTCEMHSALLEFVAFSG